DRRSFNFQVNPNDPGDRGFATRSSAARVRCVFKFDGRRTGRKRLHSRVHVMYFGLGSAHPRQGRQLPPELYTSLVASLYGDPRTLLVGAAGSFGAALVTAWKSAEPLILL